MLHWCVAVAAAAGCDQQDPQQPRRPADCAVSVEPCRAAQHGAAALPHVLPGPTCCATENVVLQGFLVKFVGRLQLKAATEAGAPQQQCPWMSW